MMFLAIVTAIATATVRSRKHTLVTSMLAPALTVGLLCGWLFSRVSLVADPAARNVGWRVFSPLQGGGGSLTFFGVGAAIGVLAYLLLRRQPILDFADAVAPSILFAVGIAKIGCLLGGCCEGSVCPAALGITYPYGSIVHEKHLAKDLVAVPADLLRTEADRKDKYRTMGHIQVLQYESVFAKQEAGDEKGIITPELASRANQYRSLPVWPVPILTSVAAIACGIAAEFIYRKRATQGATFAFVLCAYGAIRLTLDWLLADRAYVFAGLPAAQWAGAFVLLVGLAIYVANRHLIKLDPE